MSFTFASNTNAAHSASATTLPVSITVSAGSLLLIMVCTDGGTGLTSITDSLGQTVNADSPFQIFFSGTANQGIGLYSIYNTTAGAHTITVNLPTATHVEISVSEFTVSGGTATIDSATAQASATTGTSATTNTLTPAGNDELLVAFAETNGAGAGTISGFSAGWSIIGNYTTDPVCAWAYQIQTTATTASATATLSASSYWVVGLVGYKMASAGPSQKGGMFFAENFRPKIPVVAAAMFMPLSWSINRRNKRAAESKR